MRVSVGAGTYVVAVSGGVDSMVLLDLLTKQATSYKPKAKSNKPSSIGPRFIVAHFDHGIRTDSHLDRKLVQKIAKNHNLTFVHHEGKLGTNASEAVARVARYEFLQTLKNNSGAKAIITAHHRDDVIETAVLNILRGSGRRGLTSLQSSVDLLRPLLDYDKEHIREYALDHALAWNEDPTNTDSRYTRNYIRHNILPKLSSGQRAQIIILLDELQKINHELDSHVVNLLHTQPHTGTIRRRWFIGLPHDIAREVIYGWLRQYGVKDFDRATVERLVIAIKTGKPGKKLDIVKHYELKIDKLYATINQKEVKNQPVTKRKKSLVKEKS